MNSLGVTLIKYIALLGLVLQNVILPSSSELASDARRSAYETDVPSVVPLVYPDNSGTYCTASVIAPGVLITAAHCMDGMEEQKFARIKGEAVPFQPVFIGQELSPTDFAILQGDTKDLPVLETAPEGSEPTAGQIAYFVGFAGNQIESVVPIVFFNDETGYADGIPGDSGGPVIAHGQLVGIIYAGAPWAPHYTLFCPLSELRAKLTELGLLSATPAPIAQ